MNNLRDYLFHDVVLTDLDDKQWKGNVFSFHDAADNDENEDSITLKMNGNDTNVVEFLKSEIKAIELV